MTDLPGPIRSHLDDVLAEREGAPGALSQALAALPDPKRRATAANLVRHLVATPGPDFPFIVALAATGLGLRSPFYTSEPLLAALGPLGLLPESERPAARQRVADTLWSLFEAPPPPAGLLPHYSKERLKRAALEALEAVGQPPGGLAAALDHLLFSLRNQETEPAATGTTFPLLFGDWIEKMGTATLPGLEHLKELLVREVRYCFQADGNRSPGRVRTEGVRLRRALGLLTDLDLPGTDRLLTNALADLRLDDDDAALIRRTKRQLIRGTVDAELLHERAENGLAGCLDPGGTCSPGNPLPVSLPCLRHKPAPLGSLLAHALRTGHRRAASWICQRRDPSAAGALAAAILSQAPASRSVTEALAPSPLTTQTAPDPRTARFTAELSHALEERLSGFLPERQPADQAIQNWPPYRLLLRLLHLLSDGLRLRWLKRLAPHISEEGREPERLAHAVGVDLEPGQSLETLIERLSERTQDPDTPDEHLAAIASPDPEQGHRALDNDMPEGDLWREAVRRAGTPTVTARLLREGRGNVPLLVRELTDAPERARLRVATALDRAPNERLTGHFLTDPSIAVRLAACRAALYWPGLADTLEELTDEKEPALLRDAARRTLGKLNFVRAWRTFTGRPLADLLLRADEIIGNLSAQKACSALSILGQLGELPLMGKAVEATGRVGPPRAVFVLLTFGAHQGLAPIVSEAIDRLARRSPVSVGLALVHDPSWVRRGVEILLQSEAEEGMAHLLTLATHPDVQIRMALAEALRNLETEKVEAETLRRLLSDEAAVREEAADALPVLEHPSALEQLWDALETENQLHPHVARAIGRLGARDPDVLDRLDARIRTALELDSPEMLVSAAECVVAARRLPLVEQAIQAGERLAERAEEEPGRIVPYPQGLYSIPSPAEEGAHRLLRALQRLIEELEEPPPDLVSALEGRIIDVRFEPGQLEGKEPRLHRFQLETWLGGSDA